MLLPVTSILKRYRLRSIRMCDCINPSPAADRFLVYLPEGLRLDPWLLMGFMLILYILNLAFYWSCFHIFHIVHFSPTFGVINFPLAFLYFFFLFSFFPFSVLNLSSSNSPPTFLLYLVSFFFLLFLSVILLLLSSLLFILRTPEGRQSRPGDALDGRYDIMCDDEQSISQSQIREYIDLVHVVHESYSPPEHKPRD